MTDCDCAIDELVGGALRFGLALDAAAQSDFVRYCRLVQRVSEHTNVTAVRDAPGIMRVLFLDSLSLEPTLRQLTGSGARPDIHVIDVGTGAGFPGIPLKIVHRDWHLTLVESIGKKARFLRSVVDELALENVEVKDERAEVLGRIEQLRDAHDVAVARAVAPLATLIELCAPFVRPGGVLLFPKGRDVDREVNSARAAARALGVGSAQVFPVRASEVLGSDRWIVRYEKLRLTPSRYPRPTGLPKSRPIAASPPESARVSPHERRSLPE